MFTLLVRSPSLPVHLPVSVSIQFLSISPCSPLFPISISPFFLSPFVSAEDSGFLSPFPLISYLCVCVSFSPTFWPLASISFPGLSLSPLSLSLFLIISRPFLAPKDRIFWSPDLSGVRVWPYRMPPLFSFLGDSELGEGNVCGVEAPLPSRLLQVALYPACLSAKGGLGQSARSAVSLAKPLPAWTPQAFPPLP